MYALQGRAGQDFNKWNMVFLASSRPDLVSSELRGTIKIWNSHITLYKESNCRKTINDLELGELNSYLTLRSGCSGLEDE